MPFKRLSDEELDASITFRCTQAEKAELVRQAEDHYGISHSALARKRVFQRPVRAKSDETMLNELRRQGGLLAKTLREHPATEDEVRRCIRVLEKCAEELYGQVIAKRRNGDGRQEDQ